VSADREANCSTSSAMAASFIGISPGCGEVARD
jgi:hypothetical protein